MTEPITPAEAPAAEGAQATPPAERTYSEAEHKAAVEAAIQARFKNTPSKDEIAALQAKAKKADELEAASLSETEKAIARAEAAEKKAAEAEARIKAADLRALRVKVGAEKGLPSALVDRLAGDDEESIAADADAILASIPKPVTPGSNPPPEAGDPKDADPFLKGFWGPNK